jgi:hypothetical protein
MVEQLVTPVVPDPDETSGLTGKGLRRRLEHARRDAAERAHEQGTEAEQDLQVEVALLREENARLKTELRRQPDVGSAITKLRAIATEEGEAEAGDFAISALARELAISVGLQRACLELEMAAVSVRGRLEQLSIAGHEAAFEILVAANGDDEPSAV